MENIYLVGSEDVRNAASHMHSAADEMTRAASNLEGVFDRHQRFMDDWLQRLEGIMQDSAKAQGERP